MSESKVASPRRNSAELYRFFVGAACVLGSVNFVCANVGAVVVKDFGRLIGVLTERDMLRAMAARVHTSDARVRQWMTEDPITAPPDMTFEEASQIMLDKGFRHLPVVDGDTILGIVSLRRIGAAQRAAAASSS